MARRGKFLNVSLERKLTAVSLLTAAITLFLAVAAFSIWEWIESGGEVAEELRTISGIVASNAAHSVAARERGPTEETLSSLANYPHVERAAVFLPDRTLFARYCREPALYASQFPQPLSSGVRFQGDQVRFDTAVKSAGRVVGNLWIEVTDDARRAGLYQYAIITLFVFAAAVAVAIPLSSFLQKRVSRPILDLSDVAKKVSQTRDYSLRAERTTVDEAGLLVDAFNEMLEEIQAYSQDNAHHLSDLRSSKDFVQATLDALSTRVAILNGKGVVESVNKAWANEVRNSKDSVYCEVGENYLHFCRCTGESAALAAAIESVMGFERSQVSLEHSLGDGERRRWFSAQVTRFQIEEEVHIVISHAETTDRKLLEERFLHSQKMQAVGSLAGGVAHDFNNFLTIINGYSDLLLSKEPPDSPTWVMAEQIREAGARAAALTSQLLVFSRKQVFQPKIIDLNKVVEEGRNLVQRLIGEHIELRLVKGAGLAAIRADRGRIEQVIMNLCVNARDAMPKGGTLTIETRSEKVTEELAFANPGLALGDYVVLSVSDTGVGMDEEFQTRIFEPFFTSKKNGKGSGLGLSTVYGIVRQSGGYIRLSSRPGRGSTFNIYFPAKEGSPTESATQENATVVGGSETILVVEDEGRLRELVKAVLEGSGYRVLTACDGVDALEMVATIEEPIDLVVTDVVMPRLNGVEMSKKLLAEKPGLKILFVSGYTDVDLSAMTRGSPNLLFLQKPFSPATLAEKVRSLLGRLSGDPIAVGRTETRRRGGGDTGA